MSEYMLRSCRSLIALTGNVLSSLVLVQLILENTCGMNGDGLTVWIKDPARASNPARIAGLAAGLPFSDETVRRRLLSLRAQGFCIRIRGGFAASCPTRARPAAVQLVGANPGNVRRLFGRLGALGVLADWDSAAT